MTDHDSQSVNELYLEGERAFRFLEEGSLPAKDEHYQEKVESSIDALVRVCQYAREAQLFSPNETFEDIQTASLKYLLAEYYLGLLTLKRTTGDRLQNLSTAKKCLTAYLLACERYQLMHEEDIEVFHREKPKHDAIREEKIARYKREKEAVKKLDELNRSAEKKERQQRSGYILTIDDDQVEDEEKQRDIYKLIIGLGCTKAIEESLSIDNESDMLTKIEEMKRRNNGKLEVEPRPAAQSQFQNFTLLPSTSKREEFKKGVFKPGWSLPTMTIEEWADSQIAAGLLPDPDAPQQPQQQQKKKVKDEESEEETKKKRDWDDWKDDNPKGQGNMNDNYFRR